MRGGTGTSAGIVVVLLGMESGVDAGASAANRNKSPTGPNPILAMMMVPVWVQSSLTLPVDETVIVVEGIVHGNDRLHRIRHRS